jgi:hypothetical protein
VEISFLTLFFYNLADHINLGVRNGILLAAEAAGINVKGWKQLIEAAQIQKSGGKVEDKEVLEVVVRT